MMLLPRSSSYKVAQCIYILQKVWSEYSNSQYARANIIIKVFLFFISGLYCLLHSLLEVELNKQYFSHFNGLISYRQINEIYGKNNILFKCHSPMQLNRSITYFYQTNIKVTETPKYFSNAYLL